MEEFTAKSVRKWLKPHNMEKCSKITGMIIKLFILLW
jgi:hypothetical protein